MKVVLATNVSKILMRLSPYLLMQVGLDLTHMKVVVATKVSKISCDYLLID
jgi:hypothetical protein